MLSASCSENVLVIDSRSVPAFNEALLFIGQSVRSQCDYGHIAFISSARMCSVVSNPDMPGI